MITDETFKRLALKFPGVSSKPHFNKTSFKSSKRIFATLDPKLHLSCLKLSEIVQDVFCRYDSIINYPVPNKWGKQGWTFFNLKLVSKAMLIDALCVAYNLSEN